MRCTHVRGAPRTSPHLEAPDRSCAAARWSPASSLTHQQATAHEAVRLVSVPLLQRQEPVPGVDPAQMYRSLSVGLSSAVFYGKVPVKKGSPLTYNSSRITLRMVKQSLPCKQFDSLSGNRWHFV